MSTLLAPSGAGSVATFRISNDGQARIALRVSVLTRSIRPDGEEENGPAGELFAIYPTRLLVEPGATAPVKVQWRGPANPAIEGSYRFVVEELEVSGGEAKPSGIRVLLRYLASLYVGGANFAPELAVTAEGALGAQGERGFLVKIENRGKRHVVALDAKLRLDMGGGASLSLASEELGALSGANFLAGASRQLFIPRKEAVPGRRYLAALSYEGEY